MTYNQIYKNFVITKQENDPLYYCKISDTQLLYNFDVECIKLYLNIYTYLLTLLDKDIIYYDIEPPLTYFRCRLLNIWGVGKRINLGIAREDLTMDSIQILIMGYEHIVLEATEKNIATLNNIIHHQDDLNKLQDKINQEEHKLVEAYTCLTQ